jgi:cell division protein FtsB
MRLLVGILLLTLVLLQYRLWVGEGSLAEVSALRGEIASQRTELARIQARNEVLEAEVRDLRDGLEALEERARSELGMIKRGELFLQLIEGAAPQPVAPSPGPAK